MPFNQLVFASHNSGKLKEIRTLLPEVTILSAQDLELDDPEETGRTFFANALLKAKAAAQATSLPVIADDSGLCVAELDGAPGIYSARWAKKADGARDFSLAMQRVEAKLAPKKEAVAACFVSALVLLLPDNRVFHFCGTLHGSLSFPPRGNNGFGYDPIFIPLGQKLTLGELEFAAKQKLSHRWRAVQQLKHCIWGY